MNYFSQFINHLHDKGIITKSGKKWTKGNLHGLLTKIFYTGCFTYHGETFPGTHEPYISRHRYELRLRKLESGFNGNIQDTHTFLLTKFLKCGSCGRILTGDKKKELYTYYKHECTKADHQTYLPESKVFEMLDVAVREMRYSPDFAENVKALAKKTLNERAASNKKRKAGIQEVLENIETRRDRVIDLWADSSIDSHVVKRKLSALAAEQSILSDRLKLTYRDYDQIIYEMCDLIDELRDNPITFLSASYEEKGKLLQLMAEGAVIHGETAQILWKEPYSFLLTNDILKTKRLYEAELGKKNRLSGLSPNSLSKLPEIDESLTGAVSTAITNYEFYFVRQKSA